MATSSSYFLNAPSLGSSTSVFSNADLTILAPDGFYSDGGISREQLSGVLLPQQTCPACATPCGTTINASGNQGIYLLDLETGTTVSDVGAVIIRFEPLSVPDGIRATLGANVYNKLTSPIDGIHQSSNAGSLTFVGEIASDCGISGTTYPALTEFSYDGTSFVATGNTQSVTVAPGDVSLGASAPGNTMMVIPKLTSSPSIINFEVVGPCSGTAWTMSVDCPILLTGFSSSVMAATSNDACLLTETTTYYNASLANTPGTVGLYDFVFADAYGSVPLSQGFYKATGSISGGNDWFEVDASGVVISLGTCVSPIIYVAAVRLQSIGSDCSSSSSDPFSAVAYISSDYADFVLNGLGKLVLDNTTGLSFGGLETQLYDPNDVNVEVVLESITNNLSGLVLGDSAFGTIVNDESVLNTGSPKVISTVSNTGTIQFALCP